MGLLSVLDMRCWGLSSRAGLAPDHSCLSPSLHSPCLRTPGWSRSPSRPNLVSLDLSFNDLTDLQGLIASLRTLPHLRVLVLQGNPLALVPYYRGFTIDSLPRLCVLDDITVSPSEKYQFRGLSRSGGEAADGQTGEGLALDPPPTTSLCSPVRHRTGWPVPAAPQLVRGSSPS